MACFQGLFSIGQLFFGSHSLHQPDNHQNQGDYYQNIDQSAQDVANQPQYPQNKKNNNNNPDPIRHH
jgi:hypothetical protein